METEPKEIKSNATYTSLELSQVLRLNHQTASKLIREKTIKATKVGTKYLVLGSDILKYLKEDALSKTRLNNYLELLQRVENEGFKIDLTTKNTYLLSKNDKVCFSTENINDIENYLNENDSEETL